MKEIKIKTGHRYLAENKHHDVVVEVKIIEITDCCYRVKYHGVTRWETQRQFLSNHTIIEDLGYKSQQMK